LDASDVETLTNIFMMLIALRARSVWQNPAYQGRDNIRVETWWWLKIRTTKSLNNKGQKFSVRNLPCLNYSLRRLLKRLFVCSRERDCLKKKGLCTLSFCFSFRQRSWSNLMIMNQNQHSWLF